MSFPQQEPDDMSSHYEHDDRFVDWEDGDGGPYYDIPLPTFEEVMRGGQALVNVGIIAGSAFGVAQQIQAQRAARAAQGFQTGLSILTAISGHLSSD